MWDTVGIVAGVVVILLLFQVLDVAETLKQKLKGGVASGDLEQRISRLEERLDKVEKKMIFALALMVGGALTLAINVGLTPLIPGEALFSETAASTLFLWRQSLSALAAVLLLLGSVGLYLRHTKRLGNWGLGAFLLTVTGCMMLFAVEWSQIFEIRDWALRAPETLQALEDAEGVGLSDIGAMIALAAFMLGWLWFSAVLLLRKACPRVAVILVIVGFFATPLLSAFLPAAWGVAAGNAILGLGWIWLGRSLCIEHPTP